MLLAAFKLCQELQILCDAGLGVAGQAAGPSGVCPVTFAGLLGDAISCDVGLKSSRHGQRDFRKKTLMQNVVLICLDQI